MGNVRTYQDIKTQEYRVFSTIPGMNELLQASPDDYETNEASGHMRLKQGEKESDPFYDLINELMS